MKPSNQTKIVSSSIIYYFSMQSQQQLLIASYLICELCKLPCNQPRLCTHCTRLFCDSCLLAATNLLRPNCPFCRTFQPLDNFLLPKTVLAMEKQVAQGVRRQLKVNDAHQVSSQRQLCNSHELPLNYYCVDCSLAICGDCGLLTSSHSSHKIMSYRDIYQKVKGLVLSQLPRFDKKLKILSNRKQLLCQAQRLLAEEYQKYKKQFESSFLVYSDKVDRQAKILQDSISAREETNSRQLQELEVLRDSIYEQMETKTQISLIQQTTSLVESIGALAIQEHNEIEAKESSMEELIDLIPEYDFWEYDLPEFSKRNGIVYSNSHFLNGVEWRLKVYPKGNGLAREKYISVFVELTKGLLGQYKYQYRIQLLNPVHPFLTVRREYCSAFEVGECWGYNQFEPLDQLVAKEYIQCDTIRFRVGVRNSNYRELAEQKKLYIDSLKKQAANRIVSFSNQYKVKETFGVKKEEESKENRHHQLSQSPQALELIKQFLLKQERNKR